MVVPFQSQRKSTSGDHLECLEETTRITNLELQSVLGGYVSRSELISLVNKSERVFIRQIKRLHVQLNDKIISPKHGFLLRRAPGHCFFDFAQEIVFAHAKTMVEDQQKR